MKFYPNNSTCNNYCMLKVPYWSGSSLFSFYLIFLEFFPFMAFRIRNTISLLFLKFIIKNKYWFCFDIKINYRQKEIRSNFPQVTLWSFKVFSGKELKEQKQMNDPAPLPYLNKNISKFLLQFFKRGNSFFGLALYYNSNNNIKIYDESSTTEFSFSQVWSAP